MAEKILMKEFKLLQKEKWAQVSLFEDDISRWNIALMVLNPDSMYYGGYFKSMMTFPRNYPYSPPQFRFTPAIFHPNVYADGRVCISILHNPGDDATSGEDPSERWSPAQRVESVLVSILSLLDDAEVSSPANVDAGVLLRNDRAAYAERVRRDVERARRDMPPGFVMPSADASVGAAAAAAAAVAGAGGEGEGVGCGSGSGKGRRESAAASFGDEGDEFWLESASEDEYEFELGGSESEMEMEYYDDDDDDEEEEQARGQPALPASAKEGAAAAETTLSGAVAAAERPLPESGAATPSHASGHR